MNIAIIGTGYVGLVTGTCFSEMGNNVACIDIDENKIQKLKNGIIPIFEPGLDDMILRNVEAQRLHFSTDITEYLDKIEVLFCAVGTPPDEDGSADLSYVLAVARTVGKNLKKHIVFTTKVLFPSGRQRK
jgi:UDPglucose 6-dehydrogenase